MQTQMTGTSNQELIEKWVTQQLMNGKTNREMDGTLFVYGNEAHRLHHHPTGEIEIVPEQISDVVVFRKREERVELNHCRACGMEYDTFKDAIECCSDVD